MRGDLQILPLTPPQASILYAEQISPSGGDTLLSNLYQHCTRPEFSCRFKWSPASMVLWDNRSTMHYAVNDYDGHRRCLYRTTIKGSFPYRPDQESA